MDLVEKYHNNQINTQKDLLKQLNDIRVELCSRTLTNYLKAIKKAGGGYRKNAFEQFKEDHRAMSLEDDGGSRNPGSSTSASNKGKSTNSGGGSRKNAFEKFKDNPGAMSLVEQYNNKQITAKALFEALKQIKPKMSIDLMYLYVDRLNHEAAGGGSRKNAFEKFKNDPHSMALVEQYNNKQITDMTLFEAYVPRLNEEKNGGGTPNLPDQSPSTEMWNFSNPTKDLDASPFIQASQIAQQSSNFTSGNPGSSEKGKSTNFSKGTNPDNWSHYLITGSAPHYGDAMPSQQAPPMHSTFMRLPSQAGTDSTNWFGGNSQNDDGSLYSVVRPKNRSSSGGFNTTPPFFPNQLQSTGRTSASNFFSPIPNTSNFNSGNPGSSSHYGDAIPFQQAPMPGTSSFPAFPNQPSNQSAQLNSSTKFVSSQPGTPSLDWSGGNSEDNDGSLASVVRPKRPSSSRGWPTFAAQTSGPDTCGLRQNDICDPTFGAQTCGPDTCGLRQNDICNPTFGAQTFAAQTFAAQTLAA
uniref:Uncharacterized protein n=1 Tax=Globodera rostochiensis TaxID=31243 RepID=A0A914GW78_GLORO